jgi:hypothetical protein
MTSINTHFNGSSSENGQSISDLYEQNSYKIDLVLYKIITPEKVVLFHLKNSDFLGRTVNVSQQVINEIQGTSDIIHDKFR